MIKNKQNECEINGFAWKNEKENIMQLVKHYAIHYDRWHRTQIM